MAENKTQKTRANPLDLIKAIPKESKREDCYKILALMEQVTKLQPETWGSIIGFGTYHYKYESGREGDYFRVGFAPRAQNIVIYIVPGFSQFTDLMAQLGKYQTGRSCLYINKLADIDVKILQRIISKSLIYMKNIYG